MKAATTTGAEARPWRWLGVVVLAASAITAGVLLYEGRPETSIYRIFPGVFTTALACVGLTLAGTRGRKVRSVAAGAGVVLAGQLAGTGLVALKVWIASQGYNAPYDNLAYLEVAAGTMAVVMTVASIACIAELVHGRSLPIRTKRWIPTISVVAGAAVVVVGDLLLRNAIPGVATRVGFALLCTLPCGVALAGTGWAARAAALAVCATAAATGLVQLATKPLVDVHPVASFVALVAACVLVACTRIAPDPARTTLDGPPEPVPART
jgi:hypothetical protein